MVTNARQVLNAAATDQDQRVLLKVVADTGNVGGDFDAVRQANARDLAKSRVRLLRGGPEDAHAHTALLGRLLERGARSLRLELGATTSNQLADGWQTSITPDGTRTAEFTG